MSVTSCCSACFVMFQEFVCVRAVLTQWPLTRLVNIVYNIFSLNIYSIKINSRVRRSARRYGRTRLSGWFSHIWPELVLYETFHVSPFRHCCRIFAWRGEMSPRETPQNDDFFVFSHGDLLLRHTKVCDSPCVAFSATVCRIFWRVFALRPFAFSPRKHVHTTWRKSATITYLFCICY